jgi:hypothetical protein
VHVIFAHDFSTLGQYMKERPGAFLQRIVRFAPRWVDSDLDAEAAQIGCTLHSISPTQEATEIRDEKSPPALRV